jgi:sugar-specific transcriptional regulator TrmB/DNA-binding CsgD family transcriptional regulator
MLEPLGVSEIEERAYDALLERAGLSMTDLTQTLGVSRPVTSRVLSSLEAKGLVGRSAGGGRRYVAAAPDIAIEMLLLRRQEDLERVRLSIPGFLEKHRSSRTSTAEELVEVVTGQEAVGQWFVQLQLSARREVLSLDRPPYVTPMVNEVELDLLGRGIRYRAIYDQEALQIPGQVEVLRQSIAAGEEARTLAGLPAKLAIADDRLALMPIRADDPAAGSVVVHGSSLLDALVMFFENLWNRAVPLRFDDEGLNPEEREALPPGAEEILPLLAAGLKDQVIARQLGLSPRTFDRRMRQLMDALDARTRFQAGLTAAFRGWLGDRP